MSIFSSGLPALVINSNWVLDLLNFSGNGRESPVRWINCFSVPMGRIVKPGGVWRVPSHSLRRSMTRSGDSCIEVIQMSSFSHCRKKRRLSRRKVKLKLIDLISASAVKVQYFLHDVFVETYLPLEI